MALRFLPRLPILRALVPRIAPPLLPLTSRRRIPSTTPSRLFTHFPARLTSNNQYSPLPQDASWTQRLRRLIKSYGWYALGVYIILSALDFGVAFAGVHLLGADYVSRIATSFKQTVASIIRSKPPDPGSEVETAHGEGDGHEGLYAMIVLAYTVHKTLFLPVRIGLTGVLTPRLVNWLRVRGWAGGEGTRRAATEIRERMRRGRSRSGGPD